MAKAALDIALASRRVQGKYSVEVRWHPFLIRPHFLEIPGVARNGFLPGEHGAPSGPYWHWAQRRAQQYGIDMSGSVDRFPHVLHAHRILYYAEREGGWRVQHDLAGRIFKAFYSDNVFLGIDNIARMAAESGLDHDAALAYLRSDADEVEVRRQARQFSEGGVTGVPYFYVNRRPAFSGAVDPSGFVDAIESAAAAADP